MYSLSSSQIDYLIFYDEYDCKLSFCMLVKFSLFFCLFFFQIIFL